MIKPMCYFQDDLNLKVVRYYMGNVGMDVYEDRIEVPKVVGAKRKMSTSAPIQASLDLISSSSYAPSRSSGGVLFVDAKTYFDALASKILADSQASEACIEAHIVFEKVAKEREEKIREEAKA